LHDGVQLLAKSQEPGAHHAGSGYRPLGTWPYNTFAHVLQNLCLLKPNHDLAIEHKKGGPGEGVEGDGQGKFWKRADLELERRRYIGLSDGLTGKNKINKQKSLPIFLP
jgi:hypothetical protein